MIVKYFPALVFISAFSLVRHVTTLTDAQLLARTSNRVLFTHQPLVGDKKGFLKSYTENFWLKLWMQDFYEYFKYFYTVLLVLLLVLLK